MHSSATKSGVKCSLKDSAVEPKSGPTKLAAAVRAALTVAVLSVMLAAVLGLLLTATQLAQAQTFTTLYSFTGGVDGAQPLGSLIEDKAGNLYGTAAYGGIQNCQNGCGTVFELTRSGDNWSFNLLYDFQGNPNDGANPYHEALAFDKAGNLYGTTYMGGANNVGSIFKLTPSGGSWTESVLYNFTGGSDGWPVAGLVFGKKGNLYGTAVDGAGEVFEVTPSGTEKALYDFTGGSDGTTPWAGLVFDKNGNLYGTTEYGGGTSCEGSGCSGCGGSGCGTVFKLAPDGTETVLYSFAGGADGFRPKAGLVLDKEGNLYGTTECGNAYDTCYPGYSGVVFEVTPTGTETVLYTFQGLPDGGFPEGALVFDKKGNLYGTTFFGGNGGCFPDGCGTVFKLTPSGGTWTETVLYNFGGSTDGIWPQGSLLLKGGILYGTTWAGGAYFEGTVFALNLKKKK